jgi:hypothetical protein
LMVMPSPLRSVRRMKSLISGVNLSVPRVCVLGILLLTSLQPT